MDSLIIIGADVCAIEAYEFVRGAYPETSIVFAEDVTGITELVLDGEAYPVVKDWNFAPFRKMGPHGRELSFDQFVIGGSNPSTRKKLAEKVTSKGLTPAPTIIHPKAWVARHGVEIGRGGIIAPFAVVDVCSSIGDYVHMLPYAAIGHNVAIGHCVNLSPGAIVNSFTHIGDECTLATSCTILNNLTLSHNVIVGAGAVVTKDVLEPGTIMLGPPARARG